ncbi:MAG TPA: 2-succinyl-5-enolpyruvyl-6-hydroxy-3-cyclohexene-1-carboxylic-acid synthase [Candidatus Limnocylindrales bacterium]|nr:2-succinyl-5-enolpyruvyl-6-hydroxy-3-cyclohexene-1-carboxylic-acid synthase [Candidatus Limnocylindrales bacterium]
MSVSLFTARVLVDELLRGGVRDVCIAPGSRSTSLALAMSEQSELRSHVLTDERSMGFFALGIARATAAPVAVVTTSGTAAANLLPAVCESSLGGGALVLLTADRPPELRDCAAPQTIDQCGLFGSHARWSSDVPTLGETVEAARVLRSIASRAIWSARSGAGGPVHLNVPLREPFTDLSFPSRERYPVAARDGGRPFTSVCGRVCPDTGELDAIARVMSTARRGVIVCAGPELPAAEIAALAVRLGWPIVADPMSGLRFGAHDRSHVVDGCEPLLRDESLRAMLLPDCILRFGLTPAPRSLQRWLEDAWPAEHFVVTPDADAWPDPFRAASTVVRSGPREFAAGLSSSLAALAPVAGGVAIDDGGRSEWLERWRSLSRIASAALDHAFVRESVLFDGVVLRSVVSVLSEAAAKTGGANLVIGNSMPVRDADAFVVSSGVRLRVHASRGASGIDGVLSTALGIAAASSDPTVLVIGDVSLLHDAAALAFGARERIPLLVVVVNNDGGGIFSFLPLREQLEASSDRTGVFERMFTTPHGTDFERVSGLGAQFFERVTTRDALDASLARGVAAAACGPALVEVRTDGDAGRTAHLAIVSSVQRAALEELERAARTCTSDRQPGPSRCNDANTGTVPFPAGE